MKKPYQYDRIIEILNDYWLTEPTEEKVEVHMYFRKHNGEEQYKDIVWLNPKYRDDAMD